MSKNGDLIGTLFLAGYADSMPQWRVTGRAGPEAWKAVVTGDSPDYRGTEKLFSTDEIHHAVAMERAMRASSNGNDAFYAALPLGATVHYHNGFGNYVRCTVVLDEQGRHALRPIALVGNWRSHDLPRRMPTGEVYLGYHAQEIANGTPWRPHHGTIFESGELSARSRDCKDPISAPAIDLALPPMTPEEETQARLSRAIARITSLRAGDPREVLTEMVRIGQEALAAG